MSLRARILLLVLLATLIPTVVVGVHEFNRRDGEIDKAKQNLGSLAKYAADNLDDKVKGTVQLLHGLSRAPELGTPDIAACSEFLAGVLARYPQYTGLLTITPDGDLHCDSLRTGRKLNLSMREYFRQVRASNQPAFEVVIGGLTGIGVLQVAYPVADAQGALKFVLLASLNLAQYANDFAAASYYPSTRLLIWNRHGMVAARNPDAGGANIVGKDFATSELFRFAAAGAAGAAVEAPDLDGAPRVWALGVLRESGAGARITLGIPRSVLTAGANKGLRDSLWLLTAVSLGVFAGALVLAEYSLRRPAARIISVAARLGAGDLGARIGAPRPRGELGDLMTAIDRTAAAVQTQQAEIELRSRELRHANRTLRVLSGINTLIVRVSDRDELFREACRIAVEEGGFRMAWIGVIDRTRVNMLPIASAGANEDALTAIRTRFAEAVDGSAVAGNCMIARAIREQRAVVSNDAKNEVDAVFGAKPAGAAIRAMAVFPLVVAAETIGVVAFYASEIEFFHHQEVKLLTELAGDIAFALEHIGQQEKLDKLTRIRAVSGEINAAIVRIRERESLLREVCRIAADRGKFDLVWVASIDNEKEKIRAVAWTGFSAEIAQAVTWPGNSVASSALARVIRTGRLLLRNDLSTAGTAGPLREEAMRQGYHSTVCLPLLVDANVVAAIVLFARGRHFFDADETALLKEMASDISFALQSIDRAERLDYLAYYDVLTGLANRTLFLERVAQYARSALAGGHKLAVGLLDLERFRNINDSLGRPAGDALLKQVAEWLTLNLLGGANLLARVDADHFAVVLPVVKPQDNVADLVGKTLEAFLQHPFRLDDAVFRVAAKVGIALFPDDGADADTLLRNAEAALKKAKSGGDRYLFYAQKMTATVGARLSLENQLREALEKNEFVLHYQPKVNLRDGRLTGAEALIRWNDPRTGLVPPGRFIPILEETGLIYDVGRWALRQAIADYLRWLDAGLPAVRMAVNVSPLQLRDRGFADEIQRIIGGDAKAAAGLELEITESVIMEDVKHNIASLKAIRAMGVTIAIDDFGTGFSSLSHLSRLPVDTLKIDRSFVIEMTAAPEGLALVSTIIRLAHSLKLKVVAEGVETGEQQRLLHLLSCDEMQGFFFSKPVPADILESRFLAPALAA